MIQGSFKLQEIKLIMNAICSYAKVSGIGKEGILEMCSKPAKELSPDHKKGWCKISESLSNRTVQSIHNFCRRRFNPDNYSGKWTEDEETALLDLVKQIGNQWKSVARILNDTYQS